MLAPGRHIETVRSLSRHKDKESPKLKRRDFHGSSAQRLGAAIAQQPVAGAAAAAASALAAAVSQAARPSSSGRAAPPRPSAEEQVEDQACEPADREGRQRRSRCNKEIEARQQREIQKVLDRRSSQCARVEQEKSKRQWAAHRAKSYLLASIKDPDLKGHVERKSRPRTLPKLPNSADAAQTDNLNSTCSTQDLDASRRDVSSKASSPANADERSCSSPCGEASNGTVSSPVVAEDVADGCGQAGEHARPDDNSRGRDLLPHENLSNSGDEELDVAHVAAANVESLEQAEPVEQAHRAETTSESKQTDDPARQRGSVQSFLDRQRISLLSKPCSGIDEWKRRNQCTPDQRVFVCCGGYPDFRDALLRRGWFQNHDKNSCHFDLKWGMQSNIDQERLLPNQVVNHFDKVRDLTTKVGLTLSIRNSLPLNSICPDSFYPRAFDLYDPGERAEFVLDWKLTKAESILRRFLEHIDKQDLMTYSQDIINVAHKVCLRRVTEVEEVMDCDELAEKLGIVPADEWKYLEKVSLDHPMESLERLYTKKELEELINKKESAAAKWQAAAKAAVSTEKEKDVAKQKKKKKKKKDDAEEEDFQLSVATESYKCPRGKHFIQQARSVLEELEATHKQTAINGSRNAWIVKPSGKSRGRGIEMLRELDEIFRVTEKDGFQWICQKYMERPQLIHGYKFDIRQWVLVTDWNPLTIYIWQQPYVRFAGQKYDSSCEDRNAYMHLVNNSILKYMDGFGDFNEDLNASGCMWFRQQYQDWLHSKYCKCQNHHTPWLTAPPYTCEKFGVRFEDVKFIAKDESDDEDEDDDQPDLMMGAQPAASGSLDAAQPSQPSVCLPCAAAIDIDSAGAACPDEGTSSADNDLQAGKDGQQECENIWVTRIKPQIEEIILSSLRCVSDSVQHRKNTTELFGYDFMMSDGDDAPKVWLIEVNSSPACDYSTPVTCPLVKQMMEDTAKVMVDRQENPDCLTGEWELLHHEFNKPAPSIRKGCPVSFEVNGTRIKRPKGWKKKAKRKKQGYGQEFIGEEAVQDDDDEDAAGGADSDSDS